VKERKREKEREKNERKEKKELNVSYTSWGCGWIPMRSLNRVLSRKGEAQHNGWNDER
jgi:hypothetical protein